MNSPTFFRSQIWLVLVATAFAAGEWLYFQRVLIPRQIADAAAHNRPRGNLSDLYPRWVGSRELLLNGRDPYSAEVTRKIQTGYYGRPLDPSLPNDPRDQAGFAYPVYVVFFLAPTVGLPFAIVQKTFFWILVVLTCASVLLWLRVLRWPAPLGSQVALLALTLGSVGAMQGLMLQQLSLLVAALVTIAIALLVTGHEIPAGILLAFATIKPQLMVLLLLWLAIWTAADWRRRYRWAGSFLVTMSVLIVASEWYVSHWILRFWHAVREYQKYTGTASVTGLLVGGYVGRAIELLTFAVFLRVCWNQRRQAAASRAFAFMLALVLAITILLVPTYGPYNQVFLIPAVLLLVKERRAIWEASVASRGLALIAAGLIAWQWASSVPLAALSFILPAETVERAWAVPLWTVTQIPIGVGALMLVRYYQTTFTALEKPGSK